MLQCFSDSYLMKHFRFNGDVTHTTFPKQTYHYQTVGHIHSEGCMVPVGTEEFIIIGGAQDKK